MTLNYKDFTLLNAPKEYSITEKEMILVTEPGSDFWQRTYYGFRNDNAHGILTNITEQYYTFTVRAEFEYKTQYDQCGVLIYQDSENWFKSSIEYENESYQRLGSVVTNQGYSDWATVDIGCETNNMFYRLSRRESDFLIESSYDGVTFKQMRIFHMVRGTDSIIKMGVYACSPGNSSFKARFSQIELSECLWKLH